MGIETERKELLKRIKKEGKDNLKLFAKQMKLPYSTLLNLVHEETMGTIQTWIRIERFFKKKDTPITKES